MVYSKGTASISYFQPGLVCTGLCACLGREKTNITHLSKLSRLWEVPEALKRLLAVSRKTSK